MKLVFCSECGTVYVEHIIRKSTFCYEPYGYDEVWKNGNV